MQSVAAKLKVALTAAIVTTITGDRVELSRLGLLAEKLGRYAKFVTLESRQRARFKRSFRGEEQCWKVSGEELVYDLGANNGDDTDYYLRKGLRVVAVEANPTLAEKLAKRFSGPIKDGRLNVLNIVITTDDRDEIDFFVNDEHDKISTAISSAGSDRFAFHRIRVKARRLSKLVEQYGKPFYVKIDLEGSDVDTLRDLIEAGWRPPFISAEAQTIEVLCYLAAAGYEKFKIVEGRFVHYPYYQKPVINSQGDFFDPEFIKGSSSGPFGEDIPGDWLSADEVFQYLATFGLGWKDIHAMRR